MHKTSIGGQALIEGILMRGPEKVSIAVRKPNGEIDLKVEESLPLNKKNKILSLPIIRGMLGLIDSLKIGMSALMYSAEFFDENPEDDKKEGKDSLFNRIFKEKSEDVAMGLTVFLSIAIAIGVFMILPNFLTNLFANRVESSVFLNLIEGIIRIFIFFLYIVWVSKLEDVRRVFEYHGAEHKSIHAYENGVPLTVDNVKKFSILHPRCGTSFLFMVMIVSIIVLSFFGWPNPVMRVVTRIVMLPVIAGISYEINRFIGKSNSKLCYYLSYPGLMIQKYATVKEPDESQIEVAIKALEAVIPENKEADLW
ncbi:MAG: DUF1385 domain-containing protein [Tissierellales bacterium]|nr:DUF1385 domain-containing protein [Tissierellales bacterium]